MALPKVISIPKFDVDSITCPQVLKLIFREQFRGLIPLRRELLGHVVSNVGSDAIAELWWKNHRNIIRAASLRPEWDWSTLSLKFDENVSRPVDFFSAKKDFLVLLGRPNYLDRPAFLEWNYNELNVPYSSEAHDLYLGDFHKTLYHIYIYVFNKVILEDKPCCVDTVYTDADGTLSADVVSFVKEQINECCDDDDPRSTFCKLVSALIGEEFVPFNKLPKYIFSYFISHSDVPADIENFIDKFREYLDTYRQGFIADVYKAIGAHQMAGDKGPVKTTLCNKLVKSYYDWLTALSLGTSGNLFSLALPNDFACYLDRMKNESPFYTDNMFKIRNDSQAAGYSFVPRGTFEQLFARLQESVKGVTTRQSFIVSFHPCDMITCSLGYNWSSCQSFVNDFTDFPRGYGMGSSYGGTYNRGNFQFLCGNCFIAYVPFEKLPDVPQYLWAKQKRCLIWINNDLNCLRQNFFYPGRPSDQETLAFGKVIREYLQNVVAPFNFSNGTMDWKSCGKNVRHVSNIEETDFDKFTEIITPNSGRYDDPIMNVSYLKGTHDASMIYATDFPTFDTGRFTNNFFKRGYNVCPICGKTHSGGGLCDHCKTERIEYNGHLEHPSNLLKVNIGGEIKYFDVLHLNELNDYVSVEDGTMVNFKDAYKVFMPTGIKYFKELPSYVKQCKVCNGYFHPSFMVGDVCVDHINTVLNDGLEIKIDFDEVLKSFLDGNLSFACNDVEALSKLLHILDDKRVKWQSGVNPSGYIPSSSISRGRFLSVNDGKLIVSSQSKSSVVKLSKLFKKGGE